MNRSESEPPQPPDDLAAALQKKSSRISLGLFLALFALVLITTLFRINLPGKPGWAEALLILSCTAALLFSLGRQLPGQNVFLAALVIAVIGGGVQTAGALTGFPFGPFTYTDIAGPLIFQGLWWAAPFIWIIAILSSRGIGRLILRPWRKTRAYGYWLIGITAVLSVMLDFAIEPYGSHVKHYWVWSPTKISFDWYGAPVTNFIGWLITALLILAFSTPAMMKRKSVKSPPDYDPLIIWGLLNLLFIIACLGQQLWLAVAFSAIATALATVLAIRGARW